MDERTTYASGIALSHLKTPGFTITGSKLRALIDDRQNSTDEQVAEFKYQLIERFPARLVNHVEGKLQNDIQEFIQKEVEPLMAYYQRALHMFRRSHGRDAPRKAAVGRPLLPIEQSVLNSIILAFLNGLRDEDVRLSNIPEDQSQHPESRACELGVQLQSFSSGPDKERQRIDLSEILDDDLPKEAEMTSGDPGTYRPIKTGRKGKRVSKHLREIVGREGCGPINYINLARRISIPINLLELWQVSPDTAKSTFDINRREILHLGYSPHEILKGFAPDGGLEAVFPSSHRESLKSSLVQGISAVFPEDEDAHGNLVIEFIVKREEIRQAALARSDCQKDRAKNRHNLGVRIEHVYSPGSLVMLWDAKAAGKKLRPAWRGPFVITSYGGDMERSYTLR
ncbi:hypothetical protein K3495_g10206 [Podosphaera aphanis]|nr:hypothetical protein K3495_g10206 [Podosphaera aphanis]